MNKFLRFLALYLLFGFSAYGQNFIQVTKLNANQTVTLTEDQVLEVKLPATPSTGFAWHLKKERVNVVAQAGDWTFQTDDASNPVGTAGIQTLRYTGTSSGVNDLEFIYKRAWEEDALATDSYKITLTSEGAYRGKAIETEVVALDPQLSDATVQNRALPAKFSWLDEGKCTVVKNQGSCGSCWAFAACGSFESIIKIFDRETRDLSEQWLVNCDKKSSGCSGGWSPNYMFKTGAVYEADLKYTAKNGTCKTSYTYHEAIKGTYEIGTTPNTEKIKQAIYDYGPVWVAVNVGSNFNAYKSGVLTKSDAGQVNHAVVLVGWDDATKSWVLRNSWGTGWGENGGYMRIGYGVCTIGYKAAYIDYKGKYSHVISGVNNTLQASAINVFPNPTAGKFQIDGLEKGNSVEVYDVVGKVIYSSLSQNNTASIDLSAYGKGMYFYKIVNSTSETVKQGKVLVQ